MAKKNIKKIFLGVILIVFSAAGVAAAFYFLEAKPRFWVQRSPGLGDARIQTDRESVSLKAGLRIPGDESALDVAHSPDVPTATGTSYLGKKEGFLWVDRKTSQLIVTLGRLNGLDEGRQLIVYEGANRLGEVVVDAVFETVSYVHAVGKFMNLLENAYYRVGTE
jgi:hypothetical protein